ncbi:MAG: glycosyltransferase [Syntrophobacteraceae bacterium]
MTEPLRILCTIVGLDSTRGGNVRSVTSLCAALACLGAEVWLLSEDWAAKGDQLLFPASERVRICLVRGYYSSRLRLSYAPGLRSSLRKLCIEQRIDIIHDHGLWLPFNHAVALTARRLGIPIIVSPRGTLEPWALSHKVWKKKLAWKFFERHNLRRAALLHATSQKEKESILSLGLPRPVAVVPNAITLPASTGDFLRTERCRNALFLSRIHPVKGLANLVSAWARVRPKGWRMIIAGGDEEGCRKEVENSIRKAGLENDFIFAGQVDGIQKEKLYRQADLFILPTLSENFGIVVAEALSYGVPVITTRGAPWEDLVTHRCGWWVDVGVEPLVKALSEASSLSDSKRQAMGERGRRYAEQHLSWPRAAGQILQAYRWILSGGSPPACVTL